MLKKKMYEFAHLFKPDAYGNESLAEGVQERLDELQKLYDRSMAKITQIRCNKSLTTAGKQEAFKDLKTELAKELRQWAKFQEGYDNQIRQIEKGMQPTRHPRDDAAWELRQREIRDVLRTFEPTELEARVREAVETGNDELLQAVQYSPVPFRLVTADLLDKIALQRWEREYPDDAIRLADLRTAHREAVSALGSVRAEFARQGLERLGEGATQADAA